MVDHRGPIAYSTVATESVTLEFPEGYETAHLISPTGQRLAILQLQSNRHTLDVGTLLPGVYQVRFEPISKRSLKDQGLDSAMVRFVRS